MAQIHKHKYVRDNHGIGAACKCGSELRLAKYHEATFIHIRGEVGGAVIMPDNVVIVPHDFSLTEESKK